MRDTINTDRHIYPLPVGYRVFWAEDTGNDGVRLLELDCVADDFGDLVGVPRNSRAVLTNDAKGWAYRAAKSEAAA